MKIIVRVAKNELGTLFYSPIAWFVMIVFLIQSGIIYLGQLEEVATQQDLGGVWLEDLDVLTERIFLSNRGLFGAVMANLYLYIPLLTMSLISRETSSGTIRLLYSSPIKVREIILGKYLSMMVYSLMLVAVIGVFIISGLFHIQSPETGMLLSSLLGFYLLLCAYSAIGLFMSCLTTYQVVAAISTFIMIGILSYIGSLWQRIEIVRELTYFLSIRGRTQNMLMGLITTKDIIYFIVIVYIFLGLSIYKIRGGMESKPWSVKMRRYLGVIASALLIGYISSIPQLIGYYDATFNKARTLTPNVQRIIAELGDAPLEVTAYNNLLSGHFQLGGPESFNENRAKWEPYLRFKHDIKLSNINYYDSALDRRQFISGYPGQTLKEIAAQYAKTFKLKLIDFKTPDEIRKEIDLRPELNRYVMQLKWKDRTTFLRVFDDFLVWPGETEVAAAFKRLLKADLPKIGFVRGNLERDINRMGEREYKIITNTSTFRYSLLNQGFDVQSISLDKDSIPADLSILVLADPRIALSPTATAALQKYIDKGGNMIIAGEPGRQAILNPLLKQFGTEFMPGTILQESMDYAPNLAALHLTSFAGSFTKTIEWYLKDSSKVAMPGAMAISYSSTSQYEIKPLLLTDSTLAWNRLNPINLELVTTAVPGKQPPTTNMPMMVMSAPSMRNDGEDTLTKTNELGTVKYEEAEGDTRGPLATAVGATRMVNGKQQRIVILGDADLMSNVELIRSNMATANFAFNTSLFSWLNYGEFPVDTSRPGARDRRLNINNDQVGTLRILYLWILPGVLLAFGTMLLVRRKRK